MDTKVTRLDCNVQESTNSHEGFFINHANVKRQLNSNLIEPTEITVYRNLAGEHTAEPIKSTDDINRVAQYLIDNQRWRDYMLFITGINFGLRESDLLQLRFCDLIDSNLCFKTTFPILEKKTSNTRKNKRNRHITINDAVVEAVTLYLEHNKCKLDDFMFRSESNNGYNQNKPMSRMTVDRVLKDIAAKTGLTNKMSSHTLRKTFGYHQMVMSGNSPRKLLLLQKIFGHSSAVQTLDYIGITSEEIGDAYLSLNLGGANCYSDCMKDTGMIYA